ncbi:hypothetical protein PHYPO_G00110620 [Pangasianodon hypophthalmus]|uniref:CWH43-like N-terminal domain-containing protein n=1 Tax=Pangasianodon hypophthalmus TaxID=310915 RepID=A0A5N5L217_PANHP|nr:hypothetical protein PHYPO_G00110620 [Pangasianodon hypophthalmus]
MRVVEMWWFQEGLCFLPVLLVVWTAATFVFAYITAVVLRHVDPFVPYISDTGTVPPERCCSAVLAQVVCDQGEKKLLKLNTVKGYTAHMVSTVSEWSLAFSFISFFLTYIRDFQKINLRAEADLQSSNLHDSSHFGSTWIPGETSPLLAGSI